ncbi:SLBB domain-containing protein [Gammaproteobacteria bacterium]|nr:SLBB domain-containing protein [Gammaproteobacteria bacterium]
MKKKINLNFLIFMLLCLSTGSVVSAQPSISPAMIEQAKKLSKEQQIALANQYGVDLSVLTGSENQPTAAELGSPGAKLAPKPSRSNLNDSTSPVIMEYLEFLEQKRLADLIEGSKRLQRFGLDFFDEDASTFYEVDTVAVPEGYQLGVGDSIELVILGPEMIESSLQIGREGTVLLPKIGPISIAGLTLSEAKKILEARVSSQMIGAEAFISMGKLKNINIFLAGEVKRPGSYSVSGITTLTQALYLSGGISEIGGLRNIQLKRGDQTLLDFDLYDLLLKGDRSNDVQLASGDVIFVPVMKKIVSVDGAVRRPGIYEIKAGEVLAELISMAGDFESNAYLKNLTIRRIDSESFLQKVINLNYLNNVSSKSLNLRDGDFVTVAKTSEQLMNPISIIGSAVRPGVYAWEAGSRIADYLSILEEDYEIEADLNIALLVRRINENLDIAVRPFSPIDVANSVLEENYELKPHDQIIILPLPTIKKELKEPISLNGRRPAQADDKSLPNEDEKIGEKAVFETREKLLEPVIDRLKTQASFGKPPEIVSISGAVRLPGEYPKFEKADIRTLIKLAGGARDGAYLKNVEIRRIDLDAEEGVVTKFINVDLTNENETLILQTRDLVRINYLPDWNPNEVVEIIGEVRFPGSYAISRGEKLSSLLSRAGGLTDRANPNGLKYFSKVTRDAQLERAKQLVRRYEREQASRGVVGGQSVDQGSINASIFEESILESFQGRIIVDTPRILMGDIDADVLLQGGDTIEVPIFLESISVAGEVYEPGSFRYLPGRNIDDYISLAAGFTDRARSKAIYIIEADGGVTGLSSMGLRLFKFTEANDSKGLSPGATIVVPTNYDYKPVLDRYRGVTSVVFESVTSLAALLSIGNN